MNAIAGELPYAVSLEDMVDEVRRELDMRRNVYDRLVKSHKMNRRQADRRIDVMAALLARLETERDASRS